MENIIPSFMRVQHGFTTAQTVTALIERVTTSGHADFTPTDRLDVIDLPDIDVVASKISSATTLSRSALVNRAIELPELLTEAELDLLLDRYWLHISGPESKFMVNASLQLLQASQEHNSATMDRLRLLRKPLYDNPNEEQALAGAIVELKRRDDAEAALRYGKDLQAATTASKGPDWARRLLEEEKGAKPWGFARYVDPSVTTHFDLEHYFARTDALLTFAKTNVRYGKLLSSNFYVQKLDWPGSGPTAYGSAAYVTQHMRSHEEQEFDEKDAARVYLASKQPDDIKALTRKFKLLREQFTSIRDHARLPKFGNGGRSRHEALVEGMLNNVFIVIDGTSVASLYTGPQYADNVWVWAVDPDYNDSNDGTDPDSESAVPQYRGFLRVRIQQLADKFFEARKYCTEVSMSKLWLAAQNSRNAAFVSLDEKEQQAHRSDRMTGSALGKSG